MANMKIISRICYTSNFIGFIIIFILSRQNLGVSEGRLKMQNVADEMMLATMGTNEKRNILLTSVFYFVDFFPQN